MTDDLFVVVKRDERGRCDPLYLDPREVSIVYNEDGSIIAYLWEPSEGGDG